MPSSDLCWESDPGRDTPGHSHRCYRLPHDEGSHACICYWTWSTGLAREARTSTGTKPGIPSSTFVPMGYSDEDGVLR